MIKEKFSKLTKTDKANLIFDTGKYIAVRYYYNYAINLYLYNGYYVEVFYLPNSNKIDKIEILEDLKTLNNYIDHMRTLKSK